MRTKTCNIEAISRSQMKFSLGEGKEQHEPGEALKETH